MTANDLAARFEEHAPHLRAVAYRMLGSRSEADDAVQEAWLRLSRTDTSDVENLRGWLTTVVARLCLDVLRSRKARREEPMTARVPEPIVQTDDPAQLADSIGVALLVVLETLAPAERIAFVLHDLFGVAFEEIATIVGKSPTAARQLASRARRRVQGEAPVHDADLPRHRAIVNAFLAASRHGDFEALLTLLDPDVVLRTDRAGGPLIRGAARVAKSALAGARRAGVDYIDRHMLVDGLPAVAIFVGDKRIAQLVFTIRGDKIIELGTAAT